MRPPVEHVRVSAKGKDILIKIKRNTGLEHWNEICRLALCMSLSNPSIPSKLAKTGESPIDIEWKTFASAFQNELTAVTIIRAQKDGVDVNCKETLAEYFRSHIERGIANLQKTHKLSDLVKY